MRIVLLTLFIVLAFHLPAQEKADSLKRSSGHISMCADFMGIGYHGYNYPWENLALTLSGEWVGRPVQSTVVRPYLSFGFGATLIEPIGYVTFSTGALFGRRNSFFRIGGAIATALTEHEIYWHISGYNGGISGSEKIDWGIQWMPVAGYTFWSQRSGFITSVYISPHFAFKTYQVPGTVQPRYWASMGLSFGYRLAGKK